MQPVPRALDANNASVAEMTSTPVLGRIPCATLLAVEQERRALDPRPEQLDVSAAHVVGRPRPDVVVELPAVGARSEERRVGKECRSRSATNQDKKTADRR